MAYTLIYSGGNINVSDGTLNTETTLQIPGRNYSGYGSPVDQNQISLLENFASADSTEGGPANSITGQLWYNNSAPGNSTATGTAGLLSALKVNFSANTTPGDPDWRTIAINDANARTNANIFTANTFTTGSNTANGTLVGNLTLSSGSILNIGSNGAAATLDTRWAANFYANNITTGNVTANGSLTGNWTLLGTSSLALGGNGRIDTRNGTLLADVIAAGLDANANANAGANGSLTGNWVLSNNSSLVAGNTTTANFVDATFYANVIRSGPNVTDAGQLIGQWSVPSGSNFALAPGGNVDFLGSNLLANYITANGDGNINGNWQLTAGSKWDTRLGLLLSNTITAGSSVLDTTAGGNLYGNWTVTGALRIASGTTLYSNTLSTGANTNAGTLTGNWTLSAGSRMQATYADIAERFAADGVYDAGTVVELGGSKEITAVVKELSDRVFGVISDCYAYLLNGAAGTDATHPPVAMSGRVPVKVLGQVTRGDRLVSAGNGLARAAKDGEATSFNSIGRALEDKTTTEQGTVLAVVTAIK